MLRTLVVLSAFALGLAGQEPALLVLHKGGSSLGYYTPEGRLLASVPTGKHPHEGVFSADGRLLYVTDNGTMRIEEIAPGGNTISIIDVAARRRAGEIPLGEYHRPHGIALDPATGRLAVSCELPDQLLIVDPAKKTVVRKYDTKGKTSHMVTFGPGGKWAYVSNSSSASVAAVELATGKVVTIPTGARPEGSVLSKDGRELYVANRDTPSISVIDTAKNAVAATIKAGKGAVRIALTPDGKQLVYALSLDNKVGFADPAARKVLGQVALGGRPISLNLSPDGKLALASAEDDDTVYLISVAERKIVRTFKTPAGMGPDPVFQVTPRK
jgi:YVTN family beta-propeller protein